MKFGGYILAGITLKKMQPGIHASALKIAAARTGLGILLGPLFSVGFFFLLGMLFAFARSCLVLPARSQHLRRPGSLLAECPFARI
jgi:hypothetical protein